MHSFIEVEEPTSTDSQDLTTLATVKSELGITDESEDEVLEGWITRASKVILALCDLVFPRSDVVETFRFETCERLPLRQPLLLRYYPIETIESITIDGATVDQSLLDVDKRRGRLWYVNGYWSGNVVVTYNGGIEFPDDVPALLERAVIELIKEYRTTANTSSTTDASTIRSVTHGDSSVSFFSAKELGNTASGSVPFSVLELIKPYQRLSVV